MSLDIGFFFFKQKTAYEMRISDWSSDVCSSDLEERRMIAAVMKLGDRPVRAVMTPRHELAWLDLAQPHDVQVQRLRDTVHLRLPAAQGGLDEPVGVVIVKDVLNLLLDQGRDALAAQGLGSRVPTIGRA